MRQRSAPDLGPRGSGAEFRAPEGPALLGLLVFALLGLAAGVVALQGVEEAGLRSLLRATARSSVLLFVAAFSASALRRLWPAPASAWLLRNRRYLGLGFAFSHTLHLLAVIGLVRGGWIQLDPVFIALGGGAYAFVYAMAATSSDAALRLLGPRRWRLLHRVGSWWVWALFAFTYAGRTVEAGWEYAPLAALLAVALALRLAARWRRAPGAIAA
jgi:hypothetical protein